MVSENRQPKVVLLVPTITRAGGGVAEAVRLLAGAIAADGRWSVEVCAIIAAGFEEARLSYGPVPVHGARRFDRTRYGFSLELVRDLFVSDADVLHVHGLWGFHCLAAHLWHLKTGRPYIITPHGMLERWILKRSRAFKLVLSNAYQSRFLRSASAVHVLTAKERTDVEEVEPGLPTTIVPNFVVPPADASSLGQPKWWRADLAGRTIYLFFGRIHEKKGCMELCDAWERQCRSDPGFAASSALVFCGWIDGLDGLKARLERLDAAFQNALFGGSQFGDDKWRSLAAASYMLLPSKSEGLPLAVLEAWAAGVPMIMTEECNLSEGFAAGAALRVTPETEGIERGLQAAAAQSLEERAAMSKAGRRLVETCFSQQSVSERMIDLYERARVATPR